MALIDGRSIALPYGLEIADGRTVRVFNREYGELARFRLRRKPRSSTLAAMDWRGEVQQRRNGADVLMVWFYKDRCAPYRNSAADTKAYLDRLERFARLKAEEILEVVPENWTGG